MLTLLNYFKTHFLKFLLYGALMLLLATPFVLFQIYCPKQSQSLNHILTQFSFLFTVFRWALIILFFQFWPLFIYFYGKKHHWETIKIQFWLRQRFKITLWLIVFELLVCENIMMTVFKWF